MKKYQKSIRELEESQKQKERALSMVQLTKAGHVYIISNIGSFGEGDYKIGMTRRLEPNDRVKELSGASVPFEYDIHGMIYTEDAPALERLLHKNLNSKRVNLQNERKEFFYTSLDEIETIALKNEYKVEFTKIAEAREYRETIAKRKEAEN